MIAAGQLDEVVTIQQKTRTPDTTGGAAVSWGTYTSGYANVRQANGREIFKAQQTQNPITHVLTMRKGGNVSSIKPAMRVLRADGSTTLKIKSVLDGQRRGATEIYLECELELDS